MTVTVTDITERGSVSSPTYTVDPGAACPSYTADPGATCPTYTADDGAICPAYTDRGTVTNPFFQGSSETDTDTTPPVLSNFHANVVSHTYVEFDWDTDEPATCRIQYDAANPPSGSATFVTHTHLVLNNRAVIAVDLVRGHTYYVRAYSEDAYGNGRASDVYVFTTRDTDHAGGRPRPA